MEESRRWMNTEKLVAIVVLAIFLSVFVNSSLAANEQPLYSRDVLPEPMNVLGLQDIFKTSAFTGALTYSYRIEVPAGTNGLTPQMNIFYISQKTSGLPSVLGTGWDLTQSYLERDINGTLYNTQDDSFKLVLEGNFYDLVYSSGDNRYHTKIESFLYIENKTGGNNSKSQYWIVREKNGNTYRFGFSNDSEAVSKGANYTWRWYADQINDTYGNSIFYSYREDPNPNDSNATYLANISYNNDRKRLINFTYESSDRPDIWETYQSGNNIKYSRKLIEIGIFANNALVRKYVFQYSTADTNARTLLSNITLFGSNGTTSLPPTSFEYNAVKTGFTDNTALNIPYCFVNYTAEDMGIRLVDVNGDGLTDIIRGYAGGNCETIPEMKKAYINNGSGWTQDAKWEPFRCIHVGSISDAGIRLADINGDGLVDIVRSYQSVSGGPCADADFEWAIINNGAGWTSDSRWIPPRCFSHQGSDQGTRFAEVNGDGLIDIIASRADSGDCENPTTATKKVFINNGSGWVENSTWSIPYCIVEANAADLGVRVIDVNGDGLDDIVRSHSSTDGLSCETPDKKWALINNGSGWVEDAKWAPPHCFVAFGGKDLGVRLIDANGDSLVDILQSYQSVSGGNCASPNTKKAYINNGSGWVSNTSWEPPYCFVNFSSIDIGTRVADINGDGLADIIRSQADTAGCETGSRKMLDNSGNQSYLLRRIRNGQGGPTSIEYKKSTSLNNTGGNDSSGGLGFNLWVVSRITRSNGMNGTANVTFAYNYNYSGGLYDYRDMEFRGFNFSQEMRPDGTKINHYFHQDDARAGREYRTEIVDSANSTYQRKDFVWEFTVTSNRTFVTELRSDSTYTFDDAGGSPRITNITYSYDKYGNILERNFSGDLNASNDEKYEIFQYAYNTALWIVDKPNYYRLLSSDSTLLKEINYSYDGLQQGAAPTKGSVTRKVERIDTTSRAITLYGYNSNGNMINITDPNNRTTNYTYGTVDTTFTYPDQETNAKSHVTQYRYDLGIGKLTLINDSNKFSINYTYDVFGRVSKEIRTFDSSAYPTKQYEYENDGIAPERTKILQREQSGTGNTFDTFEFIDGLGNVIQTKKESDNSKQIVIDTVYDGMGRIATRSNPYKANAQETYTQPSTTVNITNFTYDPMDRIIKIVNPDGTQKTFNYTKWNVTITDENSNKRMNVLDAYSQIVEVIEYEGSNQYKTNYTYDAQGNLVKITDSQNNIFTFTYDNLGRKTSMTDPDMGTWTYKYDAAGNIIQQKDNRNTSTDFQYDPINRLIRRNSSAEYFNFTYDTGMNGTLSKVQSVNSSINLTYDARLRVTKETKTIGNATASINYTYDALDRIVTKFLPNGNITYAYTNQSTIKSINGILNNITYNELDQIERRIYDNTLDTNFTYDPQNLMLTQIVTGSIQNITYAYDNASNIIQINDTINQRIYRMTYDALHRLATANRTDSGTLSYFFRYTYNSIGNLIRIVSFGENIITYIYGQGTAHAPTNITIQQNMIDTSNLTVVYANRTERVFRFSIRNLDISTAGNVTWTLNTGQANISSQLNITLLSDEAMFAYAYYNYSASGNYTVTASSRRNNFEDNATISTEVIS